MFYNNGQKPTYETIRTLFRMENQLACVIPHDKWDGNTGIPQLIKANNDDSLHHVPRTGHQGQHGGLAPITIETPNYRPYDKPKRRTSRHL